MGHTRCQEKGGYDFSEQVVLASYLSVVNMSDAEGIGEGWDKNVRVRVGIRVLGLVLGWGLECQRESRGRHTSCIALVRKAPYSSGALKLVLGLGLDRIMSTVTTTVCPDVPSPIPCCAFPRTRPVSSDGI